MQFKVKDGYVVHLNSRTYLVAGNIYTATDENDPVVKSHSWMFEKVKASEPKKAKNRKIDTSDK